MLVLANKKRINRTWSRGTETSHRAVEGQPRNTRKQTCLRTQHVRKSTILVRVVRGSVMNEQYANHLPGVRRPLNAVALQNAVLCAECDVVSDSPHDRCLVCGSPSLFNIAHLFGGKLPRDRATLIEPQTREPRTAELVLAFPRAHKVRRKVSV